MRMIPLFEGGPQVSVIGVSLSAPPTASLPLPRLAILAPHSEDPSESGEDRVSKTVRRAVALGVNLIDTDWITANGHAQEALGRALAGLDRESLFITGKAGPRLSFQGELIFDNSRANVMNQCHDSLFRLKTGHIDLYQIHWPDGADPAQTAQGLDALRHQGLIRHAGVCNHDAAGVEALAGHTRIASVQMPFNVLNRNAERELLPLCRESGRAFLACDPLMSGLLTGRFRGDEEFSDPDRDEWFTRPRFDRAVAFAARLADYAAALDLEMATMAVAWCLAQPGVTSVLYPVADANELEPALAAVNVHLSAKQLEEIEELRRACGL